MHPWFRILVLFALVALGSCTREVENSVSFEDSKTRATVILVVRDFVTGKALEGVLVSPVGEQGDSARTDSLGYVRFDGITPGSHQFILETAGYGSALWTVVIGSQPGDVPFIEDKEETVLLRPLTGVIRGIVSQPDAQPAAGATVQVLLMMDSINPKPVQAEITGSADADGVFSIDSLPLGCIAIVRVNYSGEGSDTLFVESDTIPIGLPGQYPEKVLRLEKQNKPFVVLATNFMGNIIASDSSISIHFSNEVNLKTLPNLANLVTQGTSPVLVRAVCVDYCYGLEIIPQEGRWEDGMEYTVHLNGLKSVEGEPINTSGLDSTFIASLALDLPEVVDSLWSTDTLDWNSESALLRWRSSKWAARYEVWVQQSGSGMFSLQATINDTAYTVPIDDLVSNGEYVVVKIVAENGAGSADPSKSPSIVLRDSKAPMMAGFADWTVATTGLDNSAGTKTLALTGESAVTFSEPMNTGRSPRFTISGTKADQLEAFWTWNENQTSGYVQLRVIVGGDATGLAVSVKIDPSPLLDWAGNACQKPSAALSSANVEIAP